MPSDNDNIATDALTQADKNQNEFSGYQGALGQAGYKDIDVSVPEQAGSPSFLGRTGESVAVSSPAAGFEDIYVGCAWNRVARPPQNFLARLFGFSHKEKVDLDLGALCEMTDGSRVALQALGDEHGSYDRAPYIALSPDERTGISEGDDEFFHINGAQWPAIKRVLIYVYIYQGPVTWADVHPHIRVQIPGQPAVTITPHTRHNNLPLCALVLLENSRNGIKISNLTEYFPGQAEMDRAYGFGFVWGSGEKGA